MSANCTLCGEPMPAGETMFKYHGYSGSCPKPPLPKPPEPTKVTLQGAELQTIEDACFMAAAVDANEERAKRMREIGERIHQVKAVVLMANDKQAKLEKLFRDFMGETVHTSFRKGCDSDAANKVWHAIKEMPPKEWAQAVEWMCWALAYSVGDKLEIKKKVADD